MLLTAFIAIIVIFMMSMSVFVYARNGQSKLNASFSYFVFAISLWVAANYLGANFKDSEFARYLIIIDFLLGPLMLYLFWRFTSVLYELASETKVSKGVHLAILFSSLLVFAITATGFVVRTDGSEMLTITYLPLYPLYSLFHLLIIIAGGYLFYSARKAAKDNLRHQINMMMWGLVIAIIFLTIANLVVPIVTESEDINLIAGNISYFGLVIFTGVFTVAIVKHKLFDVRLIVARSIAYFLSIATFIVIYALAVSIGTQTMFSDQELSLLQQTFYISMSILVGLLSVPLKRVFDRFTNNVFYRDAYEAQTFLDELNKELVSNIDLEVLLHKCTAVIEANLKPSYLVFNLNETAYSQERVIGTDDKRYEADDMKSLRDSVTLTEQSVIAADDLSEGSSLKPFLRKYDIAILSQLSTNLELEGLGYLVLGPKKSGNPYNKQDLRMIEIITNELVIAIQNALRFEEIEKFNVTLQEKVDSATAELKRTNEKLKELDETKDEFISMASHQLRTPLTSVKGYLSMVLEGDVGEVSEQQRKMLDQAFISSQRMVYLIADLLNVSRLKTGKFIIDSKATNLADVVDGEVSQLIDTAKSRQLELTYEKPNNFPTVMLDETKIRQVMMNFIDNAIYYTPAGGKIEVVLEDTGKTIEYRVHDNGIGVPKNERHHLFNKFYRANNARKARPDGTGLGLFMAKKVVVAQGGVVLFDSEEGKGSTFGFSFEKAKLLPKTEKTEEVSSE